MGSERLKPANLIAAAWALRAIRKARDESPADRLESVSLPGPPRLPESAIAGVRGALVRRSANCLTRAMVLQRWELAHGRERDLVLGVTGPDDFRAHAWLEPEMPGATRRDARLERAAKLGMLAGPQAPRFEEIHRIAAKR